MDRSGDTELEGFVFPVKTNAKAGDSPVPNDSLGINDVHLFAPDTLDFAEGISSLQYLQYIVTQVPFQLLIIYHSELPIFSS